jgi:asparagine synthase (glutamine-hydrolysing)
MCGIIGSNFHNFFTIKKALKEIKNRGPDQTGIVQQSNFIIGANRLAIQDLLYTQQPIEKNNKFMVYNGEIWNGFSSLASDTKYVLSEYLNNGINCFKNLNGMFGLCILDDNKLILARDFIGEIPLYYFCDHDRFCFASELKCFKHLGIFSGVKCVNPGSTIIFENNNIEIDNWYSLPKKEISDTKNEIAFNFRELLEKAVKIRIPKEVKFTSLLSGGIDSTIVTYLLKKYDSNLEAYTIQLGNNMSNKKTNDLYYAREVAKWLNIKLNEIIITKEEENEIDNAIRVIEDDSWTQISSAVCHLLMIKNIHKQYKVVFSGSGSDEIFASYPIEKRWLWKDHQYDDARRKLITNIHKNNIIRENKCFMNYSFEPRSPFLDKDFIEYAINIPIQYRYENKRMKPILRYAFPEIPEHILWREKVCEGEGVGIDFIIKENKQYIKTKYKELYGDIKKS